MKRTIGLFLMLAAVPLWAQQPSLAGDWLGVLKVSGIELRLVFHLVQNDSGYTATMDSPDQGAKGIPVAGVRVTADSLLLDVAAARSQYLGAIAPDGQRIDGVWKQGGFNLELNLTPQKDSDIRKRPQTPQPPFPYAAEDVVYDNPASGFKLAGTLTLPPGEGPFPAALLITGSGSQDRDGTIMEHKPFWVIADNLTRRGLAVLRVDDRGVGGSTGRLATATTADFVTDVLAGLAYLKTRPEIDAGRMGLIGHSEGGIIAPMAASQSPDVAFVVLLAGPGLTGEEILYLQADQILRAEGGSAEASAKNRQSQEALFAIIKNNPDIDSSAVEMRRTLKAMIQALPDSERQSLGDVDQYITGQIRQVNSPWFRYFVTYDPLTALKKVHCPILALFGGKDLQVPPQENCDAMQAVLEAGGHPDYTVKTLPNLNHLFQNAGTGAPSEYGKIEESFSPEALGLVGDWIAARFIR